MAVLGMEGERGDVIYIVTEGFAQGLLSITMGKVLIARDRFLFVIPPAPPSDELPLQ